jgi:hypothetical protein
MKVLLAVGIYLAVVLLLGLVLASTAPCEVEPAEDER